MERQFSIGLVVGLLVSGVVAVMVTVGQQLGIGLISAAFVVWVLFVFQKSPLKQKWWSVSNKLGIALDGSEVRIGTNEDKITFRVGLTAMPSLRVNKIGLRIGRISLETNWMAKDIQAVDVFYLDIPKPAWLNKGHYEATLCAYTSEGFSKSDKFSITVS